MRATRVIPPPDSDGHPLPSSERRVAVVPVLLAVAAVVAGVVVTAVIIGLATASDEGTASVDAAAPTSSPAASTSSSPAPPVAARPEAAPGQCVDALAESTIDLDLVSVLLQRDEVVTRFTLTEFPAEGEVLLGVTATGRQERSVVLAVRVVDGVVADVFTVTFDAPSGNGNSNGEGRGNDDDDDRNEEGGEIDRLDRDRAVLDGRELIVSFPDDAVRDLGDSWAYFATATIVDAGDRCPAEGAITIAP